MWFHIIEANARERQVLGVLWTDLEKYFASLLPEKLIIQVRVSHDVFVTSEKDWLGSFVSLDANSCEIMLRPNSEGGLYRICLHEVGHALGLEHGTGVMAARNATTSVKLTPYRRRRWLRDFGNQLLKRALAGSIT